MSFKTVEIGHISRTRGYPGITLQKTICSKGDWFSLTT